MLLAVAQGTFALAAIGLAISALLARTTRRFAPDQETVADQVNRLLPQTQCAQCGYPGCRPYAEAIANGEAINKCPPGGNATIDSLAALLGQPVVPLDPSCGEPAPPQVAVIREPECIGCTLCIQACPVDAIIGSTQTMHTVIASECTGCELCVEPCPVDCIDLVPIKEDKAAVATSLAGRDYHCIRCGECETACPRALFPQELFWYRDAPDTLAALDLDRCIECRLCDRACPSEIPLTDFFRLAKQEASQRAEKKAMAEQAEARYLQHEARIASQQKTVKKRPSADEKAALLQAIKSKRS